MNFEVAEHHNCADINALVVNRSSSSDHSVLTTKRPQILCRVVDKRYEAEGKLKIQARNMHNIKQVQDFNQTYSRYLKFAFNTIFIVFLILIFKAETSKNLEVAEHHNCADINALVVNRSSSSVPC
jgi:hypothetical protein